MNSLLHEISIKNPDLNIKDAKDLAFKKYGRILDINMPLQYIDFLDQKSNFIKEYGEYYIPSEQALESLEISKEILFRTFAGVNAQMGWYVGAANTTVALEYHKCSEILLLSTPCILSLGHIGDVIDHKYDLSKVESFFVDKNTCIELYTSTLHYAPMSINSYGVRQIVIQQKDTNTDFVNKPSYESCSDSDFIFQKNKFLLIHEDALELKKQGAYTGLIGQKITLNSID